MTTSATRPVIRRASRQLVARRAGLADRVRSGPIRGSPGAGARFPGAKFIDRSAAIRRGKPKGSASIQCPYSPRVYVTRRYLDTGACVRDTEDERSLERGNGMQMAEPRLHPARTLSARKIADRRGFGASPRSSDA